MQREQGYLHITCGPWRWSRCKDRTCRYLIERYEMTRRIWTRWCRRSWPSIDRQVGQKQDEDKDEVWRSHDHDEGDLDMDVLVMLCFVVVIQSSHPRQRRRDQVQQIGYLRLKCGAPDNHLGFSIISRRFIHELCGTVCQRSIPHQIQTITTVCTSIPLPYPHLAPPSVHPVQPPPLCLSCSFSGLHLIMITDA